jgi:hypothetical protein
MTLRYRIRQLFARPATRQARPGAVLPWRHSKSGTPALTLERTRGNAQPHRGRRGAQRLRAVS